MNKDDRHKEVAGSGKQPIPLVCQVCGTKRDDPKCPKCNAENAKKVPWHELARNLATIGAVIVASVALCLNQQALSLNRQGLEEARKANAATQHRAEIPGRPWVLVDQQTPMSITPDTITVRIHNFGARPAFEVAPILKVRGPDGQLCFPPNAEGFSLPGPCAGGPTLPPDQGMDVPIPRKKLVKPKPLRWQALIEIGWRDGIWNGFSRTCIEVDEAASTVVGCGICNAAAYHRAADDGSIIMEPQPPDSDPTQPSTCRFAYTRDENSFLPGSTPYEETFLRLLNPDAEMVDVETSPPKK